MTAVIFLIPLLAVWLLKPRRCDRFALFVVLGYLYPMELVLNVTVPGYAIPSAEIPPELGNYVRVAIHLLVFGALAFRFLTSRQRLRVSHRAILIWALLTLLLMTLSITVNYVAGREIGASDILRVVALGIQVANVFLLIPFCAAGRERGFLTSFAALFPLMAVGFMFVSIYTCTVYGFYPTWAMQLGRPVNSGALASFLAGALFLTRALPPSPFTYWLTGLSAVGIMAAGARLPIVLAIVFLLKRYLSAKRLAFGLAVLAVAAAVLYGGQRLAGTERGAFLNRSDLTSGRLRSWAEFLSGGAETWLWGIGGRYYRGYEEEESRGLRLHNGVLESVASYGLPYTCAVFMVYVIFARALLRRRAIPIGHPDSNLLSAGRWLAAWSIPVTFVYTTLWTNLGDADSLTTMIFWVVLLNLLDRYGGKKGLTPFPTPKTVSAPLSASHDTTPLPAARPAEEGVANPGGGEARG